MELIQSIDFSVLDFIREHLNCRFLDIFSRHFHHPRQRRHSVDSPYRRAAHLKKIPPTGLCYGNRPCLLPAYGQSVFKAIDSKGQTFHSKPRYNPCHIAAVGIFIPLGPFIFVIHIGSDNGKIQPQACRSSNSRSCTDSIFKAVFLRAFPHRCAGRHADGHNFRTCYI